MKFVNNTGKDVKIKVLNKKEKLGFSWITAKVGQEVDIPRAVGEIENFTHVNGTGVIKSIAQVLTRGKNKAKSSPKDDNIDAKTKPSDTDTVETDAFEKKLTDIKGIGKRIVVDILKNYPTEKILVKAITDKEHLPVRNDVAELLKENFGLKSDSE